jgi:hypothetical protein
MRQAELREGPEFMYGNELIPRGTHATPLADRYQTLTPRSQTPVWERTCVKLPCRVVSSR